MIADVDTENKDYILLYL